MFFILRKDYSAKERREVLSSLCSIFDVEGIDKAKLLSGFQNEDFTDFEDCLQMECAKAYNAGDIVTRNLDDYKTSEVQAILPREYLELNSIVRGGQLKVRNILRESLIEGATYSI